ncbi:MAG: glycosyltransferase [Duncaniella sp.]|nr:glycosyltransferase [Duncaniella sp.]
MSSSISKILRYITHPGQIVDRYRLKKAYKNGDFKTVAGIHYKRQFGREINWESPEDINQWINWLEFNTDTTDWSILADKYRMREFVTDRGCGDHLVKLLAVWDKPEEISFEELPDRFVLKANNGCGDVLIVKDKSQADVEEVKTYFKNIFSKEFGKFSAEPHYLRISPVIIAEEMLDPSKQEGESSSLIDYKFWCFNGKPVICFACSNRTKQYFTTDVYSATDWKRVDEEYGVHDAHHLKATKAMSKPSQLEKMLEIASTLSKGYPQMRVDFYQVDGKVYVGEMTMTSACGRMDYFTPECLTMMGRHCKKAVEELKMR